MREISLYSVRILISKSFRHVLVQERIMREGKGGGGGGGEKERETPVGTYLNLPMLDVLLNKAEGNRM